VTSGGSPPEPDPGSPPPAGSLLGAAAAAGIAWVLRGAGGGTAGTRAAQGTLGTLWIPGPIGSPSGGPPAPPAAGHSDT
jgi:aquaporin Z